MAIGSWRRYGESGDKGKKERVPMKKEVISPVPERKILTMSDLKKP